VSEPQPSTGATDPAAYSVDSFCRAHHITRSHFYALLKAGRAPAIIKLGRRTIVAGEEAARWRRSLQAAAGGQQSPEGR
jgi:hypothetical protein